MLMVFIWCSCIMLGIMVVVVFVIWFWLVESLCSFGWIMM